MTDLIDRQEAIEALKRVAGVGNRALEKLRELPSAHRPADEWCTDCSEYDHDKHCCPRFNRVIRSAVDDSNTPNTLEALKALERILNYCEEIDLHLPEAERSGYRMLPDYETVRAALTERKHGRWIDLRQEGDSRFMCSVCKWKEHVPTCMGEPTVWEYCPSCGAKMQDGEQDG